MDYPQDDEVGSINRLDTGAVRAQYAVSLAEQPLPARTREAYLAAVTAFLAWLAARDAGPGHALVAPRARDLAARDYKRYMKVDRGLSPASVNQALAGMDHLFRFLGLGAAIVRREELPRSAPRALDTGDLARLSPTLHAHINLNDRYHIHPERPPRHHGPRPRRPHDLRLNGARGERTGLRGTTSTNRTPAVLLRC